MIKLKGILRSGLSVGLAMALMMSTAACGKEDAVVEDYGGETNTVAASSEATSDTEADAGSLSSDGRSLTEMFGENISEKETFSIGGVNVKFNLNYKVPDAEGINVYEGGFIFNDSETEKKIVNNFFGGTEKNLEEIKYEDETEYMLLLYKYTSILMAQSLSDADVSEDSSNSFMINYIDSSFSEIYTWVDEENYYIHMYEGEYDGNRYGMIYSYDNVNMKRNIFICPISIAEYFPETEAKTLFVVDPEFNSGADNLCSLSNAEIMNEAGEVVKKLELNDNDVELTVNPNMAVEDGDSFILNNSLYTYSELPKLVFLDSDMMGSIAKMNMVNPTGSTYAYKILTEQSAQPTDKTPDEINITENGYAVYLTTPPFSGNVLPQTPSTFNRGSIYYTDKGLYIVDVSVVANIDNVVKDVQLLSFDNIKERFKEVLEADPEIAAKVSGSVEVTDVDFTYVLIRDEQNPDKASYVPAWYFRTKDNNLKSGEQPIMYRHLINAIDGSDLGDTVR